MIGAGHTASPSADAEAGIATPAATGRWQVTWLIMLVGLTLTTADQALFTYVLGDMARSFGRDLAAMAAVISGSFLAASLLVVACGVLADRIGRRPTFTVLLATSALLVGLQGLTTSFWQLAALRIAAFAVSAGLYPVTNTIILESAPVQVRGAAAGSLQIAYPIGFFLSSLAAAPLIEHGGWRVALMAAFAVVPLALLLGLLLREPVRAPTNGATGRMVPLFRGPARRTTLVCLGGTFLVNLAIGAMIYFVPTYLVEDRGLSSAAAARTAGAAFGIGAVGYVLAAAAGQWLLPRRDVFVLWCLLGAAAYAGALWNGLPGTTATLIGLALGVTFLFGSEAVRMPMIGERYAPTVRATGTAVAGSVGVALGSLVAPPLIVALRERLGWAEALTFGSLVPLVFGALLFLALPRRAPPEPA